MRPATVLLSSSEPSGDLLADVFAEVVAGSGLHWNLVNLRDHVRFSPVFGFWEGLRSSWRMRPLLAQSMRVVDQVKPSAALLVSFAGFNLPLGMMLRRRRIPVVYLAPPQLWAWGDFRIKYLKRAADAVVCLFAFEQRYLGQRGVDARYFGYPLFDAVASRTARSGVLAGLGIPAGSRYVAFLPGSRPSEASHHRPLFEDTFELLRDGDPALRGVMVAGRVGPVPDAMVANSQNRYDTISCADLAYVVSGTATAETLLLGTPMVISYHLATLTRWLARQLVHTKHFGIPNILAGATVVPELLDPSAETLAHAGRGLLDDEAACALVRTRLGELRPRLGPAGAMDRVRDLVLEFVQSRHDASSA